MTPAEHRVSPATGGYRPAPNFEANGVPTRGDLHGTHSPRRPRSDPSASQRARASGTLARSSGWTVDPGYFDRACAEESLHEWSYRPASVSRCRDGDMVAAWEADRIRQSDQHLNSMKA